MMPDKVYIREYPDGLNQFWDRKKRDDVVATIYHEFIRKDALLEKIDDAIAHLSDGSLTGYYESLAYKDIRELIESM